MSEQPNAIAAAQFEIEQAMRHMKKAVGLVQAVARDAKEPLPTWPMTSKEL